MPVIFDQNAFIAAAAQRHEVLAQGKRDAVQSWTPPEGTYIGELLGGQVGVITNATGVSDPAIWLTFRIGDAGPHEGRTVRIMFTLGEMGAAGFVRAANVILDSQVPDDPIAVAKAILSHCERGEWYVLAAVTRKKDPTQRNVYINKKCDMLPPGSEGEHQTLTANDVGAMPAGVLK